MEKIIGYTGTGKNPQKWKFQVRWRGYDPEDDIMLDWSAVKDLAALDDNSKENPHLKLIDEWLLVGANTGQRKLKRTSVLWSVAKPIGRFWIRFRCKNIGFGNFAKSFIF